MGNRSNAFLPRIILFIVVTLLIGKTVFAQTESQIDSIEAEFYKVLKNTPPPSDTEIRMHQPPPKAPDTVHFARVHVYKPQALPALFETAFFNLFSYKQDTMTFFFVAVDIGELNCETGRLIACDPIVMKDVRPFIQQFPAGRFPVQLSIATNKGRERVAFSRICFSDEPVVKWEFALDSGKEQQPIFGGVLYGYSVDGGVGIFIDEKANQAFTSLGRTDSNLYERAFSDEMDKHDHRTWQYGNFHFQEHNVVSFTTGFGDGRYGTYVGYDKNGKICRLLTDFGLFDWWKK